jgi:hypothetical protein
MTREAMEVIIWIAAVALPFSFIAIGYFSQAKTRKVRRAEIRREDGWLEVMDPAAWNEYLKPIPEAVDAGEQLLS